MREYFPISRCGANIPSWATGPSLRTCEKIRLERSALTVYPLTQLKLNKNWVRNYFCMNLRFRRERKQVQSNWHSKLPKLIAYPWSGIRLNMLRLVFRSEERLGISTQQNYFRMALSVIILTRVLSENISVYLLLRKKKVKPCQPWYVVRGSSSTLSVTQQRVIAVT